MKKRNFVAKHARIHRAKRHVRSKRRAMKDTNKIDGTNIQPKESNHGSA